MPGGQGGVIINEVVRAINEMRACDILWNIKHPHYNTPARQQAIEISAKRTDLSVERLSNLIRYVKKKYAEEVIRLQSDDPEVRERTCWKWYWKCHFLKEPQEYLPLYPDPHFMMQNYQVVPQEAIPAATPLNTSMSTEAVYIKTEDDSLESTPAPKVFILDPDSGINCKTEGNPIKCEKSPEDDSSKRKFIIESTIASVKFDLCNRNVSQDDLADFHSELIRYMHQYFMK